MAFTKLEKLLNQSIYKAGLTYQIKNSKIFDEFINIVSQNFDQQTAQKIKPLYIKDKVLTVACLSAEVVQAIENNQRDLLETLNLPYQKKVVEKLRFIS